MEEKYALYVLQYNVPRDDFWHLPLGSLETIVSVKLAYDGWKNNPRVENDTMDMDEMKERAKERAIKKFAKEGGDGNSEGQHES